MINNTVKASRTVNNPKSFLFGGPSIPINTKPNPLVNAGSNLGVGKINSSPLFNSIPGSISITKGGTGIGGTRGIVPLQSAAKQPLSSSTPQTPQTPQTPVTNPYTNPNSSIYQQNPLWMRPGETSAQYSARIAAQNQSTGSGSDTGAGTQNQNTTSFPGITQSLVNTSSQPSATYTQAQQVANDALQKYQQVIQNMNQALADNAEMPQTLEMAQGRAAIIQNKGLQDAANYASVYNSAIQEMGAGTNQQIAQQQGLGTAGNLAQTQFGQPGQAGYNPLTGTYTSGGTGQITPDNPFYPTMQTYAQQLANNQVSALPSSITGNPVLFAQVLNMAAKINPNFNYNAAVASGAAQQYNIQTGGTAGVTAAQNVFNTSYSTYNQLQNNVQNIDSFGQLLVSGMTNQSGVTINPTEIQGLNQTIAQFRSQLSNASQAQFDSTLAALQSKISGLLSVGGNEIPTQITADAQQIMSGTLPMSSLQSVLYRIQQEGNSLLTNQANIVNQNWQRLQSGGTLTTGGTQNATGTTTDSIYNF